MEGMQAIMKQLTQDNSHRWANVSLRYNIFVFIIKGLKSDEIGF
jgi:hypothetical protein